MILRVVLTPRAIILALVLLTCLATNPLAYADTLPPASSYAAHSGSSDAFGRRITGSNGSAAEETCAAGRYKKLESSNLFFWASGAAGESCDSACQAFGTTCYSYVSVIGEKEAGIAYEEAGIVCDSFHSGGAPYDPCVEGRNECHYTDFNGDSTCSAYSSGAMRLCACVSACEYCPGGQYTSRENTDRTCDGTPCAAGTYGPAGTNPITRTCTPCPTGRADNSTGQWECDACEPGWFQNVTGSTHCKACSNGTTSYGAALECVECSNPAWCLEGGTCSVGRADIGCTACDTGYYAVQDECEECPKGYWTVLLVLVPVLLIGLVVLYKLRKAVNCAVDHVLSENTQQRIGRVAQAAGAGYGLLCEVAAFMTMLNFMQQSTNIVLMNFDWPVEVKFVNDIMNKISNLDLIEGVKPECAAPAGTSQAEIFELKFFAKQLLPLAPVLLLISLNSIMVSGVLIVVLPVLLLLVAVSFDLAMVAACMAVLVAAIALAAKSVRRPDQVHHGCHWAMWVAAVGLVSMLVGALVFVLIVVAAGVADGADGGYVGRDYFASPGSFLVLILVLVVLVLYTHKRNRLTCSAVTILAPTAALLIGTISESSSVAVYVALLVWVLEPLLRCLWLLKNADGRQQLATCANTCYQKCVERCKACVYACAHPQETLEKYTAQAKQPVQSERVRQARGALASGALGALLLSFTLMAGTATTGFDCVRKPSTGVLEMRAYPNAECFETNDRNLTRHPLPDALLIAIWGGVVLFVCACALLWIAVHLRLNESKLRTDAVFMRTYGSLYLRYEPEYYAWEVIVLARKMLLVLISKLLQADATAQLVCSGVLIGGALLLQLRYKPYLSSDLDRVESTLLVTCLLLVVLGGLSHYHAVSSELITALYILLLSLTVLSIVLPMRSIWRNATGVDPATTINATGAGPEVMVVGEGRKGVESKPSTGDERVVVTRIATGAQTRKMVV